MSNEWIKDLINGYIRMILELFAPDIIVFEICKFYKSKRMIPCNIFDNKYNCINKKKSSNIDNIISMTTNKYRQYYLTMNNELYVQSSSMFNSTALGIPKKYTPTVSSNILYKNKFFTGDKSVQLVSHGLYNPHTFMYTVNNELYGCGGNGRYQLGTTKQSEYEPLLIKYNFDSMLISIECGYYHSVFLSEQGLVYGCGNNNYGQLTQEYPKLPFSQNNKKMDKNTIHPFTEFKNIIQIACTSFSTILLDSHGKVFTFGNNNHAELGVTDSDKKDINELNIIGDYISGGSFHVGCLTKDNNAYFFGWNNSGQCGSNEITSDQCIYTPTKIVSHKVNELKCGRHHSIIKTINDKYYAFGMNKHDECLQENFSDKIRKPQQISIKYIKNKIGSDNDIIDFIPACEHTFILQKL